MDYTKTKLKQLVILSGKGGTGKTTLSAALSHLASESQYQSVFVDADVDAANLALITEACVQETHPFTGGALAEIDPDRCNRCGACFNTCRYDAILPPNDPRIAYKVVDLLCDGCAACVYVCPESAIQMAQQQAGEWFHSTTPYGHQFHAELFPAAENTGKLVTTVKQHAKLYSEDHNLSLMIVDGPPGIGCPVISASAGADLALLVAEPGVSGIHDLERIIQTLRHFTIPALICINKADIYPKGTKEIKQLAQSYGYAVASEIPFDNAIPKALISQQPVTRYSPDSHASMAIREVWEHIQRILFSEGDI